MEGPPAVGVDDPVEDDGEEEEGKGVEDFVVDVDPNLEGGQACVACEEEQQEEDSCRGVSVCRVWRARARLGSLVEVEWRGELAELSESSSCLRTCERKTYPHLCRFDVARLIINDLR